MIYEYIISLLLKYAKYLQSIDSSWQWRFNRLASNSPTRFLATSCRFYNILRMILNITKYLIHFRINAILYFILDFLALQTEVCRFPIQIHRPMSRLNWIILPEFNLKITDIESKCRTLRTKKEERRNCPLIAEEVEFHHVVSLRWNRSRELVAQVPIEFLPNRKPSSAWREEYE